MNTFHVQVSYETGWDYCGCQQHHSWEDAMMHADKHIGDGSQVRVVSYDKDERQTINWESGEAA